MNKVFGLITLAISLGLFYHGAWIVEGVWDGEVDWPHFFFPKDTKVPLFSELPFGGKAVVSSVAAGSVAISLVGARTAQLMWRTRR